MSNEGGTVNFTIRVPTWARTLLKERAEREGQAIGHRVVANELTVAESSLEGARDATVAQLKAEAKLRHDLGASVGGKTSGKGRTSKKIARKELDTLDDLLMSADKPAKSSAK